MSQYSQGDDSLLPQRLAQRLERPLPQREAMRRYAPQLAYGRHFGPAPYNARAAAVLLLLYPHEGRWHLPLIVRPDTMADHAGQVSLPGGVVEPSESSSNCALREYEEELGVARGDAQLIGPLSPLLVFISNFQVTPWIATVPRRPDFRPNPAEVAELIELPIATLLDPATMGSHLIVRRALQFRAPHFAFGRSHVWGATCMILGEFSALLGDLA